MSYTKAQHEEMIRRAKEIATRRVLRMYQNPDSREARLAWDRFVTAEYRQMASCYEPNVKQIRDQKPPSQRR